ncbi:MAG: inorganic phosphate transporter [Candidatus Hydrogenedentota bacterium]
MDILITIILVIAGFYVGWNIGANDAANCIGTSVGGGIISYKKAIILMAIFVFIGSVLQGHYVMKTIGKGIIISDPKSYVSGDKWKKLKNLETELEKCTDKNSEEYNTLVQKTESLRKTIYSELEKKKPKDHEKYFPKGKLPDLAIFVALLSAGFFVTLATFFSLPVSTSQSIVGGVAGVGLGIVGFQTQYFKINVLTKILGCWVLCPILTMILSMIICFLMLTLLRRYGNIYWQKTVAFLVILSACYVAYSLGANDVGNAIGPLLNKYPEKGLALATMGGIALAVGGLTFGKRVTETVGKNITPLDLPTAFSAQMAAAFGVHLFSIIGVPVSTSQSIVGAVIGVGLYKGIKTVSAKKIMIILIGWVAAPSFAAFFAAIVYRILYSFFA